MPRFIVFANRNGGCGKTTTAVNVAHALAMKGQKVLLIDADPQAHATTALGIPPLSRKCHILHLLREEAPFINAVFQTHIPGVHLIPASRELGSFELDFSCRTGSETLLSESLYENAAGFDYLIFDPPPAVGLLTLSTLVAAQEVFIPMQMHFPAMEGLAEMMQLIYTVNATHNANLRLSAIIPTFFNKNTRLAREITEDIVKNFGADKLFPGIRMNISLAEAPGHGKSIFEYAPQGSGAQDYLEVAHRIDRFGKG
jgi:chromosome partitioning protein